MRTIHQDAEGVLWVGTYGGGLDRFDPELEGFIHYRHDPDNATSLSEDRVRIIYEDRTGNFWVGTYEGGLNRFDRETGAFEHFRHDPDDPGSLSDNRVRWILQDRDGVLWVGTDGGLNEWQPDRASFRRYLHNPADAASIADDRVMTIYQDRGGVLWVGTQGGLSKWNPTTGSFVGYTADPLSSSSLSSNSINCFAESEDGTLWVGTYAGLNRLDRESGQVKRYRHDPQDPQSLQDERVMSMLIDSKGRLWLGTYEGGLHLFDKRTETFTIFRHDPKNPRSLSRDGVTAIYEDGEGVIWVGTYGGGLNRLDPATHQFVHYRHDPSNPTSLSSDRVLTLHEDSLGVLWVGTDGGGLSGFDRKAGTFTHFRAKPDNPNGLSSDVTWALHEDRDGNLWIGTRGSGLNRWSLADRKRHRAFFDRITKKDGLSNDVVYGIEEDDHGSLWLSTNQGLSKLEPATGTFRHFDDTNGLQSNEFNFGAHYRSTSGEMFFGGNNGFNSFFPDRIHNNRHTPPVVLTSFLKNNAMVEPGRPLSELEQITLQHQDYVVTFEFAALDFTAPEKNRYAYRLEGFDEDWVELGHHRRVTYTNLDPGRYTFRVKGSNNDGLWNEQGFALSVQALPPPWRTWWAYSGYALALGAVILAYTRAQARKLEKEAEYSRKLEQEVQARTRELAQRNEDLEQANNKLQLASFTDSLTGLRNRRFLVTTIEEDIALVDRYHEDLEAGSVDPTLTRPDFLFLIFDLDGFKEVNDTHGHAAGDLVLIQVRDILERACRRSDTVIRWGGDEFLVVGRYADRDAAELLSERIRQAVTDHTFDLGTGQSVNLTCSIGYAYYPFINSAATSLNWEQVVAVADRALYVAKNSGRNAWVGIYDTEKTHQIPSDELMLQVNDRVESLVEKGYLELRTSIRDEQKLVWAWG